MTQLITQAELEHLSEPELRLKYTQILNDLARQQQSALDCPLIMATLRNIQEVIVRRRALRPKF